MNTASREAAARCALLLREKVEELRDEIRSDPELSNAEADPVLMGLLLLLCGTVMNPAVWDERAGLFAAYGSTKWPHAVTVRQRIEELLNGVNIRADFWRLN